MSDVFDYLKWRGDILFTQLPLNEVDALILSALSYIQYDGVVPDGSQQWKSLKFVAEEILVKENAESMVRVKQDLELLKAVAESERFGKTKLSFYQDIFIPEEDTQFAAITYLLEDGSAFLAFRGTDSTLVGWKEDFNMTFQESVPAQRLAQEYVQTFAATSDRTLRLGGHSKGGNLAVYAAAKCGEKIQKQILEVYNQDGPGFTENMLIDKGYLAVVPKIKTYVPQASLFGMLLEREESYTVVKSNHIGVLQHDPYTWDVMGKGFIVMEERTGDSYFLDKTFKNWLAGMTMEERNEFFDAVFDLFAIGDASRPRDIMKPQNLVTYLKTLKADENMRRVILTKIEGLLNAAKSAQKGEDVS